MLKPAKGYVIVKLRDIEKKGGIFLAGEDNKYKEIIVESVGRDVEHKKGDNIVLSTEAKMMKVFTEDGDRIILHADDIIATK